MEKLSVRDGEVFLKFFELVGMGFCLSGRVNVMWFGGFVYCVM